MRDARSDRAERDNKPVAKDLSPVVTCARGTRVPGIALALQRRKRAGSVKALMKRVSFLIAPDLLERLRVLKARTGVSESEQIREGIRMWLESYEWPAKPSVKRVDPGGSDGQ